MMEEEDGDGEGSVLVAGLIAFGKLTLWFPNSILATAGACDCTLRVVGSASRNWLVSLVVVAMPGRLIFLFDPIKLCRGLR